MHRVDSLCKILIAEDELMIRQGIKYLIDWETHGFEVVAEAKNGREALEMIEKKHPDVVITDIIMPIMNGIDLITEVTRCYPHIQIIVLSGYSNFEYVKHSFRSGAIDYILKPSLKPDELLLAVKKAAGKQLNEPNSSEIKFSIKHYLGQILSGHCPQEAIDAVRVRFSRANFILFGMSVEDFIDTGDMESFISFLNGIESEYMDGIDHERIVFDRGKLIYIINCVEHTDIKAIEKKLSAMAYQTALDYPEVFFVCGNQFMGVENIGVYFRVEFAPYLRECFYHKSESFICVSSFERPDGEKVFKLSDLSKLLSVGNVEQAINLLAERFEFIINHRLMTESDIKTLAQNAVYQVITVIDETLGAAQNLDSLKARSLARISKARFAEDFLLELSITLDEISGILGEFSQKLGESAMSKILAYINEHYDEQLTLSQLASKFNLNYNYLSSYFGSNNAEGFSKYLTHVRINKAKELLSGSVIPVSDICKHVGYTDHSYFTKVFRKSVGITPSDYRAKLNRGRHE